MPDTADRFDLHLELLFSLAPDAKAGMWTSEYGGRNGYFYQSMGRGEKWNSLRILEMCAVFKMRHGNRGESNADGHTERE